MQTRQEASIEETGFLIYRTNKIIQEALTKEDTNHYAFIVPIMKVIMASDWSILLIISSYNEGSAGQDQEPTGAHQSAALTQSPPEWLWVLQSLPGLNSLLIGQYMYSLLVVHLSWYYLLLGQEHCVTEDWEYFINKKIIPLHNTFTAGFLKTLRDKSNIYWAECYEEAKVNKSGSLGLLLQNRICCY